VVLPYNGLRWLADLIVSLSGLETTAPTFEGGGTHDP
jgi:hypothetical protein